MPSRRGSIACERSAASTEHLSGEDSRGWVEAVVLALTWRRSKMFKLQLNLGPGLLLVSCSAPDICSRSGRLHALRRRPARSLTQRRLLQACKIQTHTCPNACMPQHILACKGITSQQRERP
eukprot:363226-Chlamydomonas_euryale.AAC.3